MERAYVYLEGNRGSMDLRNRSSWLAVVLSLSMAFSPALAMASEATENQPDDQIIAEMLNEAGDQMPEGASDEEDGIGEGSGTEGTSSPLATSPRRTATALATRPPMARSPRTTRSPLTSRPTARPSRTRPPKATSPSSRPSRPRSRSPKSSRRRIPKRSSRLAGPPRPSTARKPRSITRTARSSRASRPSRARSTSWTRPPARCTTRQAL